MFIKTENKIIGINDNSRIYLKNYEFETGYKYPEYGDGVILMCNGEEIKAYKKIICNGNRYLYRETISENMKKAQEDLDKIYEALKNNKRFVEI